jgi:hypothetical protein
VIEAGAKTPLNWRAWGIGSHQKAETRTMLDAGQPFRPVASNDNFKLNPDGSADF